MGEGMNDLIREMRAMHWASALPVEREAIKAAEARQLESWLDDEPACEAVGDHNCTIHVTARAYWCRPPSFVCGKAEENVRIELDRGVATCAACKSPVGECWRVVSI